MKSFDRATDGAWRPSPGSIYPTLTQLQDEGLIVAIGEGRSSEFQLTDWPGLHRRARRRARRHGKSATGQSDAGPRLPRAVSPSCTARSNSSGSRPPTSSAPPACKAIDDARRALYLILAE